MKSWRAFPYYPFLLALYSVLALLAYNISEVEASVVVRPAVILLAGCAILLLAFQFVLKNWQKAGFVAGFWMLLFITYGHVYGYLETTPSVAGVLGRHRFLFPLYASIAAGFMLWVVRKKNFSLTSVRLLNTLGIVLLMFPVFQISTTVAAASRGQREASQWTFSKPLLQPTDPEAMPDVYYIVLDTYTSSKALAEDFSFDNSDFEASLREMGFYVAVDSQTNYQNTQGALTATLNLEYLPELTKRLETVKLEDQIWVLLKQSMVRHQLERIGYRTVAFDTSYEWSRIKDADIFLGESRSSVGFQQLAPFERMWANSTALIMLNELEIKARTNSDEGINHPWSDHIQKQLFVLKTLPEIADNPNPTFTFAHILIPHVPYVFAADGSILTDTGYFGTQQALPVDEEYLQKGYTGEIAFINSQMKTILAEILDRSTTPPIIVVMGDHGLRDANRAKIFYAVYLPNGADSVLYPSISPVNTFRVIFDEYFGTSYGLLPDVTE